MNDDWKLGSVDADSEIVLGKGTVWGEKAEATGIATTTKATAMLGSPLEDKDRKFFMTVSIFAVAVVVF
jgi:hypothetical protein